MNPPDPTLRRTVSLAIEAPDGSGRILAVRRPPDDPDLPDVWGLPAGRIGAGESPETAALRAGREKLGVELTDAAPLRRGGADRTGYRLEMVLFGARISAGEPRVPQPGTGSTQYAQWRWADPAVLEPAAALGSLCCRLFLDGQGPEPHPLEVDTPEGQPKATSAQEPKP